MVKIPRGSDNPIKSSGQSIARHNLHPTDRLSPSIRGAIWSVMRFSSQSTCGIFCNYCIQIAFSVLDQHYIFPRSFLIHRPPKYLSFDILTCWYYGACWASVNDSAGDMASLTSTKIYFTLVFRNHLDFHEPIPPSYIWLELFRWQKAGK